MKDILLHNSLANQKARKFRKNYKPTATTVSQGVQAAISLLQQVKSHKRDNAAKH